MSERKPPTVSVIIPTYNRAALLGRAVRSVLEQTYQDFEVIIVDDASIDSTRNVVRSFLDTRVRYIRHERRGGAGASRNTGIMTARGQYIAFQDSDDQWLPTKLEKQIRVFDNLPPTVGIVYTDMWRINGGTRRYWRSPRIRPEDGTIYKEALDWRVMGIGIGSAVIRRDCFDRIGGFSERLPRYVDFEFFVRLSKRYFFYHIDEPLVHYHATTTSISECDKSAIEALGMFLEKYSEDMKRRSLAKYYYLIGHLSYQNGRTERGRSYLLSALRAYPLGIKYLLAGILSFLGVKAYNVILGIKREICAHGSDAGFVEGPERH